MEIKKITVAGVGEIGGKMMDVLASASLAVTISDYNFKNADLVIEALHGDAEAKKRVLQVAAK